MNKFFLIISAVLLIAAIVGIYALVKNYASTGVSLFPYTAPSQTSQSAQSAGGPPIASPKITPLVSGKKNYSQVIDRGLQSSGQQQYIFNPQVPPPSYGQPASGTVSYYQSASNQAPANASPYYGQVKISWISSGYGYPSNSEIELYANTNSGSKIDITGWKFQSGHGSQLIPGAIDIYNPWGLTQDSDILLSNGDTVNMYSNASAIGHNLHLNKCIGYLQSQYSFDPSLPQNCPTNFDTTGASGACVNYLRSLYSCSLPVMDYSVSPMYDAQCVNIMRNINYTGCFNAHRSDSDFLSHQWWVWGVGTFYDQLHDTVQLLDKNGLLVDQYQY